MDKVSANRCVSMGDFNMDAMNNITKFKDNMPPSQSKTPRADNQEVYCYPLDSAQAFHSTINFARQIESELNEVKEELEEYRSIAEKLGATKAIAERDQWKQDAERLAQVLDLAKCKWYHGHKDVLFDAHDIAAQARKALNKHNQLLNP